MRRRALPVRMVPRRGTKTWPPPQPDAPPRPDGPETYDDRQEGLDMDMRLTGKRALVTGSSSGLGQATAQMLAAEGVAVVVPGRDEARATAVAETIRSSGGRADVAVGDLTRD